MDLFILEFKTVSIGLFVFCVHFCAYFFQVFKIRTIIRVPKDAQGWNQVQNPEMIETTVKEYDAAQLKKVISNMLFRFVCFCFLFFLFKY
jgi:hypothetical protein